ncbi:MAG: TIGR04282 family arsenosugar biosynthesis glycosyltransferase [Reichenbachiella sp.]|uniref:TIGR04282 family arsenosugar biosynthesis glycosyltransferase n=1 Tax=Reichenbachiella sp. TaxID=2184521 RepID=UPI0032973F5A
MSNEALIIFAKNPEIGQVKTRLAKKVGDAEALAIYEKLLAFTQVESAKTKADVIVYFTPKIPQKDGWGAVDKKLQSSGDLGIRMSDALKSELANYDKVCIIGTDCAQLTGEFITDAFAQLNSHDVVLGPANDGGYYLLGMKQFEASLFEGIDWSTEKVLNQTVGAINALNKSYALLPQLIDVDTIEDWEKVKQNFE